MRFPHVTALALLVCGAALPALAVCPLADPADCIYVDDSCTGAPGSGTQLDPFCTITEAYASVVTTTTPLDPATILVMPGVYSECPDLALTFEFDETNDDRPVQLVADAWLAAGSPIPNLSSPAAFESVAQQTTISGLGVCDSDLVGRTPTLAIAGSGASVRGFTITSGGLSGIEVLGPVTIESNLIAGNTGDVGGGILLNTVVCAFGDVTATIANNVIRNNVANDEILNDPKEGFDDGFGAGGGIFVEANGAEPVGSCIGGQSLVDIRSNLIINNTATNPILSKDVDTFAAGGGIDAETFAEAFFFEPNLSQARIVIEENVIRQNVVVPGPDGLGFGAGIFANLRGGFGMETIEIRNNQIGPNNVASSSGEFGISFGGGISASCAGFVIGQLALEIDRNTIDLNQADVGGGADVLGIATGLIEDSSMSVVFNGNTVSNNVSVFEAGGLNMEFNTARTIDLDDRAALYPAAETFLTADLTEFVVSNNVVRGNSSGSAGGGAALRPSADSDEFAPLCIPSELRASTAIIDVNHNLFEDNTATDLATFGRVPGCSDLLCEVTICGFDPFCCDTEWDNICAEEATEETESCDCDTSNCCVDSGQQVIGSGILVLPTATGEAYAAVTIDDSTVVDNKMLSAGFVGGVEIAAATFEDCASFYSGEAVVNVYNSLIAFNDADGIGGPPVSPLVDLTVDVQRSSVFGNGDTIADNNPDQNYEPTLFPGGVPPGNIEANPLLNAATFVPGLCSPVYDVGSCKDDPSQICFFDADCAAPTPTSGLGGCNREGAGFYGSPDINGDDAVDGIDLMRFSSAFGATDGLDPRYTSEADVDGDGVVDGSDLPFIAPLFGQECVQN